MSDVKERFVYVTYIASTPEKVFAALTDAEMTKVYWGVARNVSDWKVGSRWTHQDYDDASKVHVSGTVVEHDPPRKLVVTWESPAGESDASKHTRVTYEVEPFMDAVKLTVTHDDLVRGSTLQKGVTSGWPAILSSLKSLLETGKPMTMTTRRWGGTG